MKIYFQYPHCLVHILKENLFFYCARGSIGDVFGYKGLKAIVVKTKKHFNAPLQDEKKHEGNF